MWPREKDSLWPRRDVSLGARLQDVALRLSSIMRRMGVLEVVGDMGMNLREIGRVASLGGAENQGHHISSRRRRHDLSDNV